MLLRFLLAIMSLSLITNVTFADDDTNPIANVNVNYDEGFDPKDPMHRELLDILKGMPNMPALSDAMLIKQFFRPAFGPTLWRMMLKPNTMQALFIGQDGTHIAEGAGYTATAGFGGRAQDMARYMGMHTGVGFMNYSFFTITKQYGAFDVPFIDNSGGKKSMKSSGLVDTPTWLLTQDVDSLMAQKRNQLIDWVMRYHSKSLKAIFLLGGAARDSIGSLVESKNEQLGIKVKVATRFSAEQLKNMEVPLGELVSAGSNKVSNVLLDKNGNDLYEQALGRKPDYKDPNGKDVKEALAIINADLEKYVPLMALTKGGLNGSGIVHPAQAGGYNINKIQIGDNKPGHDLFGLPLSDGTKAGHILVATMPHPTRLSMMTKDQASEAVAEALEPLRGEFDKYGHIVGENGQENLYAKKIAYEYGRTSIPIDFYANGTPGTRMLDRSDAYRMKPDIVVLGTRDQAAMFDRKRSEEVLRAKPGAGIDPNNLYNDRPRMGNAPYENDRGPGPRYMKIIRGEINLDDVFALKPGQTDSGQGIEAYYTQTHPNEGAFGHIRGPVKGSRVLILADPDGLDSWLTSKASTGARGQYLHALMTDMGIGDKYTVIQTVPFGMDNASASDWNKMLAATNAYREKLIKAYFKDNIPEVIITDGTHAKNEMARIIGEATGIPVVNIDKAGYGNDSGIKAASHEIAKLSKFKDLNHETRWENIPRTHLPYIAKTWWGTSGDRVLTATNQKFRGKAFAVFVPKWASSQKMPLNEIEQASVEKARSKMTGLPDFKESPTDFFVRRNREAKEAAGESVEKPSRRASRQERLMSQSSTGSATAMCVKYYSGK